MSFSTSLARPFSPAVAAWLAAIAVAVAGLSGCGGGTDVGTIPVSGTVTLDGKPVDQAGVAFIGKDGTHLATTTTDREGKFTIRAAPGKNVVTVAKTSSGAAVAAPADELMPSEGEYKKLIQAVKADVPAKYGDPKTSPLSFEISQQTKNLTIDLSSK